MEGHLFGIPNVDVFLVLGILIFFALIETIAGYLKRTKRTRGDWIQEFGGFVMVSVPIKTGIVFSSLALCNFLFFDFKGILTGSNFALVTILYMLGDDLLQYWYHRSAHEYQFLWKLHRTHHQAEELGFFAAYRNAGLYYVLMPNLWLGGIFVFLGGAKAVALGLIIKQVIVIGAHSTITWDKFLYKHKFLNPLTWILEHIFITPAFHYAHHGKTKRDGISDPNGNFGNMFSIWDQLFGTATFTRQFPTELGLENDPKEHWTEAYFHPFIKAKNPNSELSKGYVKHDTTRNEPSTVHLEKGKKYLYCACGMSKNQPFCDSSHHGSKKTPVLFEAKRTGEVRLCNCKKTKSSPFCDDSHITTAHG